MVCLSPRIHVRNLQLDPKVPLDNSKTCSEEIDTIVLWKEVKERDKFEPQVLKML
jgi:hypothetical protein